jgi:L-ascorbate metabolism protein UlaG (beta-lactamase superfamily)
MTTLFLKENVKIEPLVSRWHASPMLMSPATAAYVTRHQLEILASFVKHPDMHRKLSKLPATRGGPYIDSDTPGDVDRVRRLIDTIREESRDLLALADALDALRALLAAADGHSLIPLYAQIPDPLRGYVELIYVQGRQAGFRLFEELLYRRYRLGYREELALAEITSDDRPFVLSTPRVNDASDLFLKLPFASDAARALTRAKWQGLPRARAAELFDSSCVDRDDATRARFDALFTPDPPPRPPPPPPRPRIRYFGHACVLIETGEENLLIDPLVSYSFPGQSPRLTFRDLPATIDRVLITHSHQDHYVLETLLQIRDRVEAIVVPRSNPGSLVDPSLKALSSALGFGRVIALEPFDGIELRSARIRGLPFLGEHGDLDVQTKLGYLIEVGARRIVFLADSNNLDNRLYEHIRALYGDIDTVFLGMECEGAPMSWLYGPLLGGAVTRSMDASRRLNGSGADVAAELVETLGAKQVYVYAMAQEPWLTYISSLVYDESSLAMREARRLVAECTRRGVRAELLCGSKDLGALEGPPAP